MAVKTPTAEDLAKVEELKRQQQENAQRQSNNATTSTTNKVVTNNPAATNPADDTVASDATVKSNITSFKSPTSIDELASMLQNGGYTPKTDAELRESAEGLYKNQLDSALLQAQQSYDTNRTALDSQVAGINTSADRAKEEQTANNAASIASLDRAMLGRGMQRSSYNAATQANMMLKGDKALAQIEQDRANSLAGIEAQKANLAAQLAQNQTAANAQYEQNVINAIRDMQDQEFTRNQAQIDRNNSLLTQLYQLRLSEKQSGGGGGYGGYSSGGNSYDYDSNYGVDFQGSGDDKNKAEDGSGLVPDLNAPGAGNNSGTNNGGKIYTSTNTNYKWLLPTSKDTLNLAQGNTTSPSAPSGVPYNKSLEQIMKNELDKALASKKK